MAWPLIAIALSGGCDWNSVLDITLWHDTISHVPLARFHLANCSEIDCILLQSYLLYMYPQTHTHTHAHARTRTHTYTHTHTHTHTHTQVQCTMSVYTQLHSHWAIQYQCRTMWLLTVHCIKLHTYIHTGIVYTYIYNAALCVYIVADLYCIAHLRTVRNSVLLMAPMLPSLAQYALYSVHISDHEDFSPSVSS